MARQKTSKYCITVESLDAVLIDEMELTAKAFKQREQELDAVVAATRNDEYPLEKSSLQTIEHETYTEYTGTYTMGLTRITLTAYSCKYGYSFTN
jgi:hypothetical protein